jgi:hypothetical protein
VLNFSLFSLRRFSSGSVDLDLARDKPDVGGALVHVEDSAKAAEACKQAGHPFGVPRKIKQAG